MSDTPGYRRDIGFFSATMIIAGSMIGSGIFIVSAGIVRQVHTGPLLLLTWCITGALTLCATLSYGELTGMMPKAGGMYVYLKEISSKTLNWSKSLFIGNFSVHPSSIIKALFLLCSI